MGIFLSAKLLSEKLLFFQQIFLQGQLRTLHVTFPTGIFVVRMPEANSKYLKH
jgi:hypothetical protein